MSDCINNDLEFHGTKKGGVRKTAVRAFRVKRRISRSLALLRKELDRYIFLKINSSSSPQMIQGFESYVTKLKTLAKKFEV